MHATINWPWAFFLRDLGYSSNDELKKFTTEPRCDHHNPRDKNKKADLQVITEVLQDLTHTLKLLVAWLRR